MNNQNLFYQQLENAGLVKKSGTLIIKANMLLKRDERLEIQKSLSRDMECPIILLPAGFELAEAPAKWIDKKDPDYSGGGYTACSVCGQRYAWGAYHEPQEFRHCPRCGHQMEVEEDE